MRGVDGQLEIFRYTRRYILEGYRTEVAPLRELQRGLALRRHAHQLRARPRLRRDAADFLGVLGCNLVATGEANEITRGGGPGAGKPLTIETVELDGPRPARCSSRSRPPASATPTTFTLSGKDPKGLFPAILGHEGAGVVVDVGPGVTSVEEGRPRHPALHARVPRVLVLHERQDQPLPGDPRDAGQGPHARRDEPLLARLRARCFHYMGTSTFSNFTVLPEIALAQDPQGRAVRQGLLHRLRRHDRHRRGHQHRQGAPGRQRRRLRPRAASGSTSCRARALAGADMIVGVDINPRRTRARRELRDDALREPAARSAAISSRTSSS